ncbi:hypothetical protein NQK81_40940 [Amycolatopsis roodepoortensis]|uniref:hypothetical protein n=1 Tax=Amycolatopsis roodepoortensis TaxID=700274 RepID=UPI00163C0053|nr:hypothetical protein [Amycolatopsis roodepoortensis]UUV31056.1 hypothetical protein NQK81_40940 [Amycolatopsis roodepoortensis]
MAPTPRADLSPAGWISSSDLPWRRLVTFGPAGFDGYARLRFVPDPAFDGQSESDAVAAAPEDELLRALFEVLATRTSTPDDCFFCLWDGYGDAFGHPKVVVPHREYFLFSGTTADAGFWGTPGPAFVWPSDRAWCVAKDVDPHWAGIGADAATLDLLLADPRLDIVAANPDREQPAYR